jgi:hypothetical protein
LLSINRYKLILVPFFIHYLHKVTQKSEAFLLKKGIYMSSIKPAAFISAVGAGVGAALGFAVAGPAGIKDGAQIGFGLGVKVAVTSKAEEAVDAVAKKAEQGVDAAGRKVDAAIDKTHERVFNAIERVADTWATIMLCGYTWQIANYGANLNRISFKEHCPTILHNLDCISLSATTFSINLVGVAASAALIFKLKEMVYDEPRRRSAQINIQVKNA